MSLVRGILGLFYIFGIVERGYYLYMVDRKSVV